MKIAYVCLDPGVPVFGRKGCSIHCQEVMRELVRREFNVELFAANVGNEIPDDLVNIPVHELAIDCAPNQSSREKALVALNSAVHEQLEERGPFDLVYERHALWSFAAMQYAHARLVPSVLEVNSPLIEEQTKYRSLVNASQAARLQKQSFLFAESIIAVSEEVAERIGSNHSIRSKTAVVQNGVDVDRFSVRSEHRHANQGPVIGFVGTLKPWHGLDVLLDAFHDVHSTCPGAILRIVGDGPEKPALLQQLGSFPPSAQEQVEWLGSVPHSMIPHTVSGFTIGVAPYPDLSDFYFSPLKVMEYMAAGLPVVASDIGQLSSLISDGETGRLVKAGCADSLSQAIQELILDQSAREKLGTAARKFARSELSWRKVVDQILVTGSFPPAQCEVC